MNSADLYDNVAFDAPSLDGDGVPNGWTADAYACRANFRYLRGGEAVQAARLDGRQPVVATIRTSETARTITTDWRMRDVRRGTVYNIRTVIPSDDRRALELTVESGVAV